MAKTSPHANLLDSLNKTVLASDGTISVDEKKTNIILLPPILFPSLPSDEAPTASLITSLHGSAEGNSHGSDICDFSFVPLHLLSPIPLFSNVYPIIHLVKHLKCLIINSLNLKEYHILSPHNGYSMGPHNVHNITFFPDTSPGTFFPIPCFCHKK